MSTNPRPESRKVVLRLSSAVIAILAAAVSVAAGLSKPFTWQIYLATSVALAGVLGTGLWRLQLPEGPAGRPHSTRSAVACWSALAIAVLAFELVEYFSSPRIAHPTLSSMLSAVDVEGFVRAGLFLAWIGGGWWLWAS